MITYLSAKTPVFDPLNDNPFTSVLSSDGEFADVYV